MMVETLEFRKHTRDQVNEFCMLAFCKSNIINPRLESRILLIRGWSVKNTV